MGLDMYLKANRYVSGWSHRREPMFDAIVNAVGVVPDEGAPGLEVSLNIGYWRKANAVHGWFVEKVQGGVDECQESDVSREHLVKLKADCEAVLGGVETVDGRVGEGKTFYPDGRVEHHSRVGEVVAQTGIAAKIMPTRSGCFFGKTEYDEDYLDDLRETIKIVDRALALDDSWDFSYRASW